MIYRGKQKTRGGEEEEEEEEVLARLANEVCLSMFRQREMKREERRREQSREECDRNILKGKIQLIPLRFGLLLVKFKTF